MKIINPEQSYTFSKYFDLQVNIDELVTDFGYSFSRNKLNLSLYQGKLERLQQGLESYRVPEDIEPLMRILVEALL